MITFLILSFVMLMAAVLLLYKKVLRLETCIKEINGYVAVTSKILTELQERLFKHDDRQ